MYYSTTYFQLRDGTGPEPLTVTQPDPDAFLTRWPDPVTECLFWIERLFWWRCATSECFLPKVSGLCCTHTDDENFQHNCSL